MSTIEKLTPEQALAFGQSLIEFFNQSSKADFKGLPQGHEIKVANGRKAKGAFREFLKLHGVISTIQGLSFSVSFSGNLLGKWIYDLLHPTQPQQDKPDEFRLFFGIYTDDFIGEEGFEEENTGRLTMIMWPYLKGATLKNPQGAEVQPFNLGGLKP